MSQEAVDGENFQAWIGERIVESDVITNDLVRRFCATFFNDLPPIENGVTAPVAIHWCLAPNAVGRPQLGGDGHPRRGGFLPPINLPRRMWAGGTLKFLDTLLVGDTVKRISEVLGVERKTGRSGDLVFVTVSHIIETPRGVAIEERQDIVYRDLPPLTARRDNADSQPRRPVAQWSRNETADSVMLFRYSALTFNGHRIHYDFPYATQVEGYDGLVVHGPLQATLLLQFATEVKSARPTHFRFRGTKALTSGAFALEADDNGAGLDLRIAGPDGAMTTEADAQW